MAPTPALCHQQLFKNVVFSSHLSDKQLEGKEPSTPFSLGTHPLPRQDPHAACLIAVCRLKGSGIW